jgi:putative addiction module component (TIGR02574 family)
LEEVSAAALALPAEARLQLADQLYQSVEEYADVEVDPELLAELDRRAAAYERGELKTYTTEEHLEKLRARRSG